MLYIHQRLSWPEFFWDHKAISDSLASVRHRQGRLLGRMESLGFALQDEAVLHTLTLDVLKSHEIEGEFLNTDHVRSSIARKLGIDIGALPSADRYVEGLVEMLMDATPISYTHLDVYKRQGTLPAHSGKFVRFT